MARNNGLDTPRETRRSIRPNYDPEAFGRMSERFARFSHTAGFIPITMLSLSIPTIRITSLMAMTVD